MNTGATRAAACKISDMEAIYSIGPTPAWRIKCCYSLLLAVPSKVQHAEDETSRQATHTFFIEWANGHRSLFLLCSKFSTHHWKLASPATTCGVKLQSSLFFSSITQAVVELEMNCRVAIFSIRKDTMAELEMNQSKLSFSAFAGTQCCLQLLSD